MNISSHHTFPVALPVLVEETNFIYPFMIVPLFVSDETNIKTASYAMEQNSLVFVTTTKQNQSEQIDIHNIYDVGVVGSIMRKVVLPDGRVKVLFQALARAKLIDVVTNLPFVANVDLIQSQKTDTMVVRAAIDLLREKTKILSSVGGAFPADLIKTIDENHEPNRIVDLISSSLKLTKDEAYALISQTNVVERLSLLIENIISQIEALKVQKEIKAKVNTKIEKINKEYFLKEQLKQIQNELGVDGKKDEEIEAYFKKLEALKPHIHEDGYKEVKRQIERYSKMHPDGNEASMIQNYIDMALSIPFGKYSKKKLRVNDVAEQLEKDHYSLKKPKERIIEFFAVKELLELRGKEDSENKGAILCFVGPPGVGKTSLANSIASALKRELVRVALGGLEDVNELRGHRRTYIGSMAGRIIQGLSDSHVMNPVFVLDEIDKVGRNMRGDPTSALLEILDPEQNTHFRDNYLNFPVDLSRAIFIATANDVSTIPAPLRDRMEFIEISSYTPNEKYNIAKKYLIPQELKKHGLKPSEVNISKQALEELIDKYVREAGVRNLRRRIATIIRKSARKILEKTEDKISITPKNIGEFLDKKVFEIDEAEKLGQVGVVNGLAWTAVGGDVLKIEAIKIKGKDSLKLTGSLGDVMKESAYIAYSVVKTLIDNTKLKIDEKIIPKTIEEQEKKTNLLPDEVYKRFELHIHVPEGATPKDGPSAGIAMASVIASVLSQRVAKPDVCMTGELTLTGKVLPIGGLKEKLIAAYKAKMKTAIIPLKNYERDLDEVPDDVKEALKIIPVRIIEEVFDIILE